MKLTKDTIYNIQLTNDEMIAVNAALSFIEFNSHEEEIGVTREQFELLSRIVRILRDE